MQSISKPHLVDLLRVFDKKRWIQPRIRYASVRSKPELIRDLKKHFRVREADGRLVFVPKKVLPRVPRIEYDLSRRRYLMDGIPRDIPRESRKTPSFSIRHGPVTLDFSEFFATRKGLRSPLSTRTASGASGGSPERDIRSRPVVIAQTGPS